MGGKRSARPTHMRPRASLPAGSSITGSPSLSKVSSYLLKPRLPLVAIAPHLEGCGDPTADVGLQHLVPQEASPEPHSPSCGPCWRLLSVPAAGLGSSSACQAGEDLLTTHSSAGTGECHCGPAARCGRAHTDPSYPSGLPGEQKQGTR